MTNQELLAEDIKWPEESKRTKKNEKQGTNYTSIGRKMNTRPYKDIKSFTCFKQYQRTKICHWRDITGLMTKLTRTDEILKITLYKKFLTLKNRNACMRNDIINYRKIWKKIFIGDEAVEVEEHTENRKNESKIY